jgi:hypothetical protein
MIFYDTMNREINSIEEIILRPEDILREIKEIVNKHKMNYLEATAFFCETNNYDVLAISSVIPQSLKTLIESSAQEMRLLKKKHRTSTLPL